MVESVKEKIIFSFLKGVSFSMVVLINKRAALSALALKAWGKRLSETYPPTQGDPIPGSTGPGIGCHIIQYR